MEDEEQPLIDAGFKLSFKLWQQGAQILDVEQIKLLDKDFKKVQDSMTKSDSATVDSYLATKQDVIKCLKLIKRCESKEDMETNVIKQLAETCPNVNFEQQTADKLAELHLKQRQVQARGAEKKAGGTISLSGYDKKKESESS